MMKVHPSNKESTKNGRGGVQNVEREWQGKGTRNHD